MEEVITKNLNELNHNKSKFIEEIDIYENNFLSKPSSLRFWSSFFVILPIFVQAPWVRYQPTSALFFTFFILSVSALLTYKATNKFFIVGSLLLGVSGSWLGGSLFWGWLSSHPILHIPVEAVALPLALVGLGSKWKVGSSFYISSLCGTAITDITIYITGIMDQWMEVVSADQDKAPYILQKTSENLLHIKPLCIIIIFGGLLWFVSRLIADYSVATNPNWRALLVASYVLQTTLIVDGIFVLVAIVHPSFSGLV